MSFHTHVAEKNWSVNRKRNHTAFKNTEQFLEAVGNATIGKKGGRQVLAAGKGDKRPQRREKEKEPEDEEEEEEGTLSVEQLLKPQEPPIVGKVSEQKRKAVFSYAVRCLNCPINYDPKMLLAYNEDNYTSLARILNLQGVDLRSEIRTARRCGKLILSELEQRLASLNNHYYYNAKNFQERSHFELWKETEEDRIKRLMLKLKGIPRFSGTLTVTVIDAKDLLIKDDENQPTSPYCFLTMNKVENKTAVINKTVDPEWNEDFTYSIHADSEVLNVQVWNKILVGSTFLGGVEIPLSEIQDLQKPTQWFQLTGQGKAKNVTGSVRLSFRLVCREGPALDDKSAGSNSDLSSFGYEQSTDHNEYYKILLHHLYTSDVAASQSKGARKRNQRKRGDDEEIIVEKWGDAWKEVGSDKPVSKEESLDVRNRREEMKQSRISASTKWLLNEYAERYGIGIFYTHLVQADMLIEPFVFTTDRLDFIYEVLIEFKIMESSEPLQMAISERKWDTKSKEALAQKLVILLRNFATAFDPEVISKGGLQTTIVLLSYLQNKDASQLTDILSSYIKSAVSKTYKSFKEAAKEESVERQLCVACGFIPAAIAKDTAVFIEEFPKDLNLAKIEGEQFYHELSKEVKAYYSQDVPLTASTFDVYFRLNDLHDVIRSHIAKKDMVNLTETFQKFIDPWVENFIEKFFHWNKESIENDDWTPLRAEEDEDEEETVVLHSSSAADLFTAFYEFLKFFQKLRGLRQHKHTKSFADAISVVVKDYVTKVQAICFEEMNEQVDDASKDFSKYLELSKELKKKIDREDKVVLTIKKELCVRINNIDSIYDQLETFCKKFDDDDEDGDSRSGKDPKFVELLEDTSAWLRGMRKEVIDAVVTKMNIFIQFALELAAQPPKGGNNKKRTSKRKTSDSEDSGDEDESIDKRLEPLIGYLRSQLIVLSDNLYYPVFLSLLNGVWEVILKDIELVILPSPDQLLDKSYPFDEDFILIVPDCVSTLSRFLYAEGRGLPKEDLIKASGNLKKILQLFEEPTTTLTKLYEKLQDSQESYKRSKGELGESDSTYSAFVQLEEAILSILARRKNDKEAIKFVKAHKSSAQNMHLTKHFGLPRSEVLADKFKCCNQKVAGGWLYVTTSYVCFDTLLFGGQKIMLKIEDIRELKKKKFAGVLDNALKIETKTGRSFLFTGFVLGYRNTCYALILKQAEKLDCLLGQAYRNGQLGEDDSDDENKKGTGLKRRRAHSRSVSVSEPQSSPTSSPATRKANPPSEGSDDKLKPPGSEIVKAGARLGDEDAKPSRGHKRGPSFGGAAPAVNASNGKKRASVILMKDSSGSTETETETDFGSASETETETEDEGDEGKSSEKKLKKEQKKKERQAKREARKAKKEAKKAAKKGEKEAQKESKKDDKDDKKQGSLEKQADRTEKLKRRFNLGDNSRFIDKFSCSYTGTKGFFYVANTHICFLSKKVLSTTKIAIPFSLITNITIARKDKKKVLEVETKDKSFEFKGFNDIDAVYQLISKGWKKRTGRQ